VADLFAPGTYLRCPGGNVERPDLQAPVVDWVALNIGSDPCVQGAPAVWDLQRQLYRNTNLAHFPWLHCRTIEDVERLIATAIAWSAQGAAKVIGLNLENVVGDVLALQEVAGVVLDFWVNPHGGQVHLATLPWVQNGQGWEHLAFAVAALEIFPDEQKLTFPNGYDAVIVDQCIKHAFDEGFEKVTLMLKTKDYAPTDYGRHFQVCHSLYTGDDIPPIAIAWDAWKQTQPCVRLTKEAPVPEKPWYEIPYPKGPPVGPAKLPRALYPPDAVSKGKTPSKDGPDVLAVKRAMKRAQRWAKDKEFAQLDDTYSNSFAHGTSSNVADSGVAGFQRQERIADTGWIGDGTYQAMRRALVPTGPNKGKPIFDSECVKLLNQAAKIDWSVPTSAVPDLGPVVRSGVSVLKQDLTHLTSELDTNPDPKLGLYPAWDDGWTAGKECLAPEDFEVTKQSSAQGADAFYAKGTAIDWWFGHVVKAPPDGATFKRGEVFGVIANIEASKGGPHLHTGMNTDRLLGRALEHHTDYTHGAPTVGEQLDAAL